jgi:hypothetical protein
VWRLFKGKICMKKILTILVMGLLFTNNPPAENLGIDKTVNDY